MRKKAPKKTPELDMIDILFPGVVGHSYTDIPTPPGATAIGFDNMVDNDGFGNYTEVWVVYFTDDKHTEELGDLEYFDEVEDAREFAGIFAKSRGLKYAGRYDADDDWRADEPRKMDR